MVLNWIRLRLDLSGMRLYRPQNRLASSTLLANLFQSPQSQLQRAVTTPHALHQNPPDPPHQSFHHNTHRDLLLNHDLLPVHSPIALQSQETFLFLHAQISSNASLAHKNMSRDVVLSAMSRFNNVLVAETLICI